MTTTDPKELLKLIKMLSPTTFPKLEYISREDLTITNVRDRGVRDDAPLTADMRYPQPASYPLGAENAHGEVEVIGDVEFTHWYADAAGITWHFVTTGDPSDEPFVLVHGFPESWFTFHNQMHDLSISSTASRSTRSATARATSDSTSTTATRPPRRRSPRCSTPSGSIVSTWAVTTGAR